MLGSIKASGNPLKSGADFQETPIGPIQNCARRTPAPKVFDPTKSWKLRICGAESLSSVQHISICAADMKPGQHIGLRQGARSGRLRGDTSSK